MTIANRLTLLRIGLSVAVFIALISPSALWHMAAFLLFLAALITDWIDGYVARTTNTTSAFGKVADPIADKILILGTLIALIRNRELDIPLWGVFLILARELVIGGLRILDSGSGRIPAAEPWGKWKMGIQSASIGLMLLLLTLHEHLPPPGLPRWTLRLPYYLTVFCVGAAWGSAYFYFQKSRKTLEKTWG